MSTVTDRRPATRVTRGGGSSGVESGALLLPSAMDDILNCVHCGFCLPACPTYEVLGDENDSPRGRIHLMRAVAEGRLPASDPSFALHIDRCLGCRACEPVCPSGVRYGFLLERARGDRSAAAGGLDRSTRRALNYVFPDPRRARRVWALLRLLRSTGLPRRLARPRQQGKAPGRFRFGLAMLASTAPAGDGNGGLPRRRPRFGAAGGRAEEGGAAEREGRGAIVAGRTVALLEGCVMSGLFGHVNRATRRVVSAYGAVPDPLPPGVCCGALHAHAGELEGARALARRVIDEFEWTGGEYLLTNSAGCGAAMKEYGEWLADDPDYAERAARLARSVQDATEWLADRSPRVDLTAVPARVAYDAPCHLLHAQRIADAPLQVLRQIPELEVVPLPRADRCCGAAGTYGLLQRTLSEELLDRKLEEIREVGARWVATGNPGCLMQIGAGALVHGLDARAVHPMQLLDLAIP